MDRLSTIAHYAKGPVVADIGTDHAYLLIELAKANKITKGYACDINEQPLQSAAKNISANNLDEKIETILSNGLENLNVSVDEIVIAGLGQNTINSIIEEGQDKLSNRIIICSNTISDKIRSTFKKLKYKIEFEKIIIDNEKFYELMIFNKTEGLEINDLHIGDYNIKHVDDNLKQYLEIRLSKYEKIIEYKREKDLEIQINKIKELI